MKKSILPGFAVVLFFFCGDVHGQGLLNFSGGNGTPFSVTLTQPITYLITAASANAIAFNFDAVGDVFHDSGESVVGSITFSVNFGPAHSFSLIGSGFAGGSITSDDFQFLSAQLFAVSPGDVVTLNAGTLTTVVNSTAVLPANGAYNTFIATNDTHLQVSSPGIAVPEPGVITLGAIGAVVLGYVCRNSLRRLRE